MRLAEKAIVAFHPPRASMRAVRVEFVKPQAMLQFESEWGDLAQRALEPNIFLDPAFALPLLQHDGFAGQPDFLLAWDAQGHDEQGETGALRLVGLLPVAMPSRFDLMGRGLARGVHHNQMTAGTPLLDQDCAMAVFEAMIAALHEREPTLNGLVLSEIVKDGPFFSAWRDHCAKHRRALGTLREGERALLVRPHADTEHPAAKPPKELRRQMRRLAALGTVTYHQAESMPDVRKATEQFLALETSGWKGRRGTALFCTPYLATFARTMTRLLAYEGRCRIDSLNLDGRPIAMGIVLSAGKRAYFWKTAYDESLAPLSPGVQFAYALTEAQAKGPWEISDSCAVPDHPMINRIWPDRAVIGDYLVAIEAAGHATRGFTLALKLEILRRQLRTELKTMVKRLAAYRAGRSMPWSRRKAGATQDNPSPSPTQIDVSRLTVLDDKSIRRRRLEEAGYEAGPPET